MSAGVTTLEIRMLSGEAGVCIEGGNIKHVAAPWATSVFSAGVDANHLVCGVYASFGLVVEWDHVFYFLLLSSTTLSWCIMLRSTTAFPLFLT